MGYNIKIYQPEFVQSQVDLIWEVTDGWKYPYQTSYDALRKNYGVEDFDPSTRFYAFEDDKLVGFITSAVVRNDEKGDYGTLRFPMTLNNDEKLENELIECVQTKFKELGISKIRAPAGKGMGNTIDLANRFGFEQKSSIFKRSKMEISQLKHSGKVNSVLSFKETDHKDLVKSYFEKSMGQKQGGFFFKWAYENRIRKIDRDPSMVDWVLVINAQNELEAFSYLHRSDHNPENGHLAPIMVTPGTNIQNNVESILSSHISNLKSTNMTHISTYLSGPLLKMEGLYNELGFDFDDTFSYEKLI